VESVLSSSLESSSSPPQSHVHMRMAATESATTTRAMYAAASGPVVQVASIMSPHAQVKSDIALMTHGVNYYCSLGAQQCHGAQPLPRRSAMSRRTAPPAAHSPSLGTQQCHGTRRGVEIGGRSGRSGQLGRLKFPASVPHIPHKLTSNLETISNHTAYPRVYSLH